MRVFISSTAYDLADARDLCAEALRQNGHEAIHHESASFPQFRQVHSHDRCILAVRECDALICIVDRRYGGKYVGGLRASLPPITVPRRKRPPLTIPTNELSATWMEVLEARDVGIPIMTFARQKTLDECELRKRNAHLKSLKMVHVAEGQYRLFDFLDWTTHQTRDNWIEKFVTLTELRDKLIGWVNSLTAATASPARFPHTAPTTGPVPSLAIFVEGEFDALLAKRIAEALQLRLRVDTIPVGGKELLLRNLQSTATAYSTRYDAVLFLADSDTADEAASAAEAARIRERLPDTDNKSSLFVCLAIPTADAWLRAMLPDATRSEDKRRLPHILRSRLLSQEEIDTGIKASASLREFVTTLKRISAKAHQESSPDKTEEILLLKAKQAVGEARKQGATSHPLEVILELKSEAEVQAAVRLEGRGQGHVSNENGRWHFHYMDTHPILQLLDRSR